MGSYIPSTPAERQAMLESIGMHSVEDLFEAIPASLKIGTLDLPAGKSEQEVFSAMEAIASKNRVFPSIFRGAGAYNHYIPSIVKNIAGKEEFLTAYTPYQAEISQGIQRLCLRRGFCRRRGNGNVPRTGPHQDAPFGDRASHGDPYGTDLL